MVKKITALILVLAVCITSAAYAQKTDDVFLEFLSGGANDGESNEPMAIERLAFYLGLTDGSIGEYNPDDKIKYTDLLKSVSSLTGISERLNESEFKKTMVASGYARSEINPKKITADDVIFAFLRIMDSDVQLPTVQEARSKALSQGILDGITYIEGKSVSRREYSYMLYNMLVGDSLRIKNSGTNIGNEYAYVNLLEDFFKIHRIKGIITGYGNTFLQKGTELKDDEVEIDGVKYTCGEYDFHNYVGYDILAFIDCSDENENVVAAYEFSKNTKVLEVNSSNSPKPDKDSFKYYNDEHKLKSVGLDKDSVIIYNGILYGTISENNLMNLDLENSKYTLINNSKSSKYNIIYIWKYQYYVIRYVNENTIAFDYNMKLDEKNSIRLDEEDTEYIYYFEGKRADSECTSVGASVGIAKSINTYGNKTVTFDVSSRTVSGTISSVEQDGNGYKLTINDKEYTMSENYIKYCGWDDSGNRELSLVQPEAGVSVEASVTYDNIITAASKSGTRENYGFLIKVVGDDNSEYYSAKLLDTDGNVVRYEFAEKVIFNDGINVIDKKIPAGDVVKRIENSNSADYRTVIMYNLNEDGHIGKLYMPHNNLGQTAGQTEFKNTYDYTSEGGGSAWYYAGYILSEPKYWLGKFGKVFVVPSVEDKDEDDYYDVKVISEYRQELDGYFDNVAIYGADKFYRAKYSVMYDKISGAVAETDNTYYITNVCEAVDNDNNITTQIHYRKKQTEYNATVKDPELLTNGGFFEGIPVSELKKGDVVNLSLDPTGKITAVRLLGRLSEKDMKYGYNEVSGVFTYNARLIDTYSDDNLLLLSMSEDEKDVSKYEIVRAGSFKNFERYPIYYEYNKSDKELKVCSFEQLRPGQDVLVVGSYYFGYDIFLITE